MTIDRQLESGATRGPASQEIDYSGYDRDRLLHFLKLRDRQAKMSRKAWVKAAREAMNGDWRSLMNRVELAEMGPVTITNGDDEWHVPGATE
jgi:hypothetical protein